MADSRSGSGKVYDEPRYLESDSKESWKDNEDNSKGHESQLEWAPTGPLVMTVLAWAAITQDHRLGGLNISGDW